MNYIHSLQLYKLYNDKSQSDGWIDLNFYQSFNNRSVNVKVKLLDVSGIKVGKNILSNRLAILNNKIECEWLNNSLVSYKIMCKSIFLTFLGN